MTNTAMFEVIDSHPSISTISADITATVGGSIGYIGLMASDRRVDIVARESSAGAG